MVRLRFMFFYIEMKNFFIRAASGIIYVALWLTGCLWYEPLLISLLLAFIPLGTMELLNLLNIKINALQFALICLEWLIIFMLFMQTLYIETYSSTIQIVSVGLLVILFTIHLFVSVFSNASLRSSLSALSSSFFYILIPIVSMLILQRIPFDGNISWLVVILGIIWIFDTMAYIAGSLFGKHKLIERVSPGKTIEGLLGGFIFTSVATVAACYIFKCNDIFTLITVSLGVMISATLGDLFESKLKREAGLKDSGKIIPGHGGLLDRLDSLLIAAPAAVLLIILISGK